jgi:lipopolysaccharide/colanic/teichoic acid biosynthesis glycosyltransferase
MKLNSPRDSSAADESSGLRGGVAIGASVGGAAAVLVGRQICAPKRLDAALIRTLDIVIAAALLLLLLPLVVLGALAVRLDSSGPALHRCARVGYRGARLWMLKLRKMHHGSSGPALTTDDDDRFTRIGRLLARLKLDEIPQLWHVLVGDMSLVGPRPEDDSFVALHAHDYDTILRVRPGLTGLSQLAFIEESRILDNGNPLDHYVHRILPQKVNLDVLYAERRSVAFNFRIMFWTLAAVVMRRQVAVHRDTGEMSLRRR